MPLPKACDRATQDLIVDLYENYEYPIQTISKMTDVSRYYVRQVLDQRRVERRPQASWLRTSKEREDEVVRLYVEERLPMRLVGEELSMSDFTVQRVLKRRNVQTRKRKDY